MSNYWQAGNRITALKLNGMMTSPSVTNYGAVGDGVTDDTSAIQAAVNAAAGGICLFPALTYATSAPIVISNSGTTLYGLGPLATPNTASLATIGPVIKPMSSWAQGGAVAPAAILIDGHTQEVDGAAVERIRVNGGNASGSTTMHAFEAYGLAPGSSFLGCAVNGLPDGTGLLCATDGTHGPQGVFIDRFTANSITGKGIVGTFGDATILNSHTQGTTGGGIVIQASAGTGLGGGGNIRVANCRADLDSSSNGFLVDVSNAGSGGTGFLGQVQLSNCTTQRNNGNGFAIQNSTSGPVTRVCPVYASNCVAQGDGVGGGSSAGWRIQGAVIAFLDNCGSLVDTVDVGGGVPAYAVTTANQNSDSPVCVMMNGGFYNSVTAFQDAINHPTVSDVRVMSYSGGQWDISHNPSLYTTAL